MSLLRMAVLLLVGLSAFAQDVPSTAARSDAGRPWAVSTADRLRERFDPDAIRARLDAQRATVRYYREGMWPINGKTHAHLYFPWELFDRLLVASRAESHSARAAYAGDIAKAGWDFDGFWSFVQTIGANHEAAAVAFSQLPKETRKGPEGSRLRDALCVGRADALGQARRHFGREAFDKFLYEAVGRHLVTWTDAQRSAEILTRVEGGCR